MNKKQTGGIRRKNNSNVCENNCPICMDPVNENGVILNCRCCMHLPCFINYLINALGNKNSTFTEAGLKCATQHLLPNGTFDPEYTFKINELDELLELLNTDYIKELLKSNTSLNNNNKYNSFKNGLRAKFIKLMKKNNNNNNIVKFNLTDPSELYASITTTICPCGKFGGTHWQGHACHAVHCGVCKIEYCCKCSGVTEEIKMRFFNNDKYHLCTCGRNGTPFLHTFCTSGNSILDHIDRSKSAIPCDNRCGCAICPDCKPGKPCSTCHGNCVVCEGIVPPGPMGLNNAEKWNIPKVLKKRCIKTLDEHTDHVTSVAYSPNGKHIASGSWDKSVKVWDAESGSCVATLDGHSGNVNSVAYSTDGKYIASGSSDKSLRVWDAMSGSCLDTLKGHLGAVYSIAYSLDGKYIASGSNDKYVKVWEFKKRWHGMTSHWKCIKTLKGHSATVYSVAYNPNGKYIASGSEDTSVKVWDADANSPSYGDCVATLEGHSSWVWSVAYSYDGLRIASGYVNDTVKVWGAYTEECIATLKGHSSIVLSVEYSPNGKHIASGSFDKSVRVWDAESGLCVATLMGHSDSVNSVAYSPNGKYIASGSYDKTIKIWEIEE